MAQSYVIKGAGKTWTNNYDALGRQLTAADPLGHTTRYGYDGVGNKVREIYPQGKEKLFEYNQKNKVARITDTLATSCASSTTETAI